MASASYVRGFVLSYACTFVLMASIKESLEGEIADLWAKLKRAEREVQLIETKIRKKADLLKNATEEKENPKK